MEDFKNEKYDRAKKRVDDIKGFYIHFAVYSVINTFILVEIVLNTNNFWQWGHFFTPFFWGIGLLFHSWRTFGNMPFLGKDWEQRQIKKIMERERDQYRKLK